MSLLEPFESSTWVFVGYGDLRLPKPSCFLARSHETISNWLTADMNKRVLTANGANIRNRHHEAQEPGAYDNTTANCQPYLDGHATYDDTCLVAAPKSPSEST